MSKSDRQKKRDRRRHASPSPPGPWKRANAVHVEANDNHANDNAGPLRVGGVWLNISQSNRFHAALNQLASADLDVRRAGQVEMEKLEVEITETLDAKRMKAVRAEIAGLEEGRGGALTIDRARDRFGEEAERLRVSRDGLETLAKAGSISRRELIAGARFRADLEKFDPERGLTPQAIDGTRKITRGGDGYQKKRLEAELRIREIHCRIMGVPVNGDAWPLLPQGHPKLVAIKVLEDVAGKGLTMSALTDNFRVRAKLLAALKTALKVAAEVYEVPLSGGSS
ncbi:hypothetical protein GCM10017620_24780 [Brevundimonas intermedia]|uniref:Uncharacterized protein n=1 Tax=Brevundimonas intermedia TaxID=74315 RepID=A0ABQ5TBP6_9CAUL|nr:hypothetical protein [Brevundimonas intermedia]GLK49505.1 hypothetical protein GCM10017620_24780 [Brevundimonas intermedia]